MLLNVFLLILGFVILIKGADTFVDGASSTARNFKLSTMFIGLTIVAFGTSAPEFAVSVKSILSNNSDMLLGNVIGSNILNILLILGVCGVIAPLTVKNNTVRKEIPFTVLVSMLLVALLLDKPLNHEMINQITRTDGIAIVLFFSVFIYYLISVMRNKVDRDNEEDKPKYKIGKSIIFTIIGIIAIIIGSDLVVDSASKIAKIMGVSQRLISLTIVAIGTSLPELVTSIVATRKHEQDLVIGNIIGSNVFNICVVLGLPVAIFGGVTALGFTYLDMFMLVASAFILFIFAHNDKTITKWESVFMFTCFVIYYSYVIFA